MKNLPVYAMVMALGCSNLAVIEPDVCGNLVLEAGEDCDGFATVEGTECGAPDSEHACAFTCNPRDSIQGPVCPDGLGCGSDGRCAAPSGNFSRGPVFPFPASQIENGDIDGDGHIDLIGASESHLHLLFGTGSEVVGESREVATPRSLGGMAVADLNQDGLSDVAVPGENGLAVFSGSAERSIQSIAYPSLIVNAADAIWFVIQSTIVGITIDTPFRMSKTLDTISSLGFAANDEFEDADFSDILGEDFKIDRVKTPLDTGELDPVNFLVVAHREIAVTFNGATKVWILERRPSADNKNVIAQRQVANLPEGYRVVSRAFLEDVDGDGDADLIVQVRPNGSQTREIALAINTSGVLGDFRPPISATSIPGVPPRLLPSSELLTVGQLSDDPLADYVFATEVLVSLLGAPLGPQFSVLDGDWRAATHVDLNRDGDNSPLDPTGRKHIDDIVALPAGNRPGVEVFLFSKAGVTKFFTGNEVFTYPESEIVAGDFNGDLYGDVAFLSRSPNKHFRLQMLYGQPVFPLESPTVSGEFSGIGRVFPFLLVNQDGVEDLLIATTLEPSVRSSPGPGTQDVSILFGDSSKGVISPLPLSLPSADLNSDVALTTLIDRDSTGAVRGLVALGVANGVCSDTGETPQEVSMWSVKASNDGKLLKPGTRCLQGMAVLKCQLPGQYLLSDVIGDSKNDLITMSSSSIIIFDGTELSASDCADPNVFKPKTLDLPSRVGAGRKIAVIDFDGDGDLDLLVSVKTSADNPGNNLIVFERQGGTLTSPRLFTIGDGGQIIDFVGLDTELNGRPSLVVLLEGESEVFLFRYQPSSQSFDVHGRLASKVPKNNSFLAIADFNSDGLADIVVGNQIVASVLLAEQRVLGDLGQKPVVGMADAGGMN